MIISQNRRPDTDFITADEIYSESWFDGAGRVLKSRTEHPGSAGGWTGTLTNYDILGRVASVSVPTEINSSYAPAGDDATRGFVYNYRYYDWMNRVVRSVPSDSTGSDGKDTLIDYSVCGCAGQLVTTIEGPLVARDDQPTQTARRKQKSTQDILGRTIKTETYEWDGSTVYSTVMNTYNGRDQVVLSRQFAGTTSSGIYQDTTASFDGHGRLYQSHKPEQRDGSTVKYTTYSYNPDDSILSVTDGRGAVANYDYNSRGLPIELSWTAPSGSGITVPGTVTFSYDDLGNRLSMDRAGVSQTTYAYDSLSRMTSETVDFDDLENNYTIAYGYHISGKLKTVTDPFSAVVTYNDDKTARTTSVTGSGFASVSTYASNMKYRAFGGLKEMTYASSDSSVTSYTYDDALRPLTYQATSSVLSGGFVRKAAYEYFADGTTKAVDNIADGRFDQAYKFDHQGRLKSSASGIVTNSEEEEVPAYSQSISYNAFGNMTSRSASVWGGDPNEFTATYTNNRKTNGNEVFDADGNIVDKTTDTENYTHWKFDASGALHHYEKAYEINSGVIYEYVNNLLTLRDGDGQIVKRHSERDSENMFTQATSHEEDTSYFVISTVLGGALTELNGEGEKVGTKVYANGAEIAEQRTVNYDDVVWKHADVVTGGRNSVSSNGSLYWAEDSDRNAEPEPFAGAVIPGEDPYAGSGDPDTEPMPTRFKLDGSVFASPGDCMFQSSPIECEQIRPALERMKALSLGGRLWETSVWRYTRYRIYDDESEVGNMRANAGENFRRFGSNIGFQEGESWYAAFVSLASPLVGQSGEKVSLSGKDLERYIAKRDQLKRRFAELNSKCSSFLKKAEISDEAVTEALNLQRAFDGERSTISMSDAGYYKDGSLSELDPTRRSAFLAQKVNDFVRRNAKAATMLNPNGEAGATVASRSDVYFRISRGFLGYGGNTGLTESTILHEALHSLTGLQDDKLYEKLTGILLKDPQKASREISRVLKENDCSD